MGSESEVADVEFGGHGWGAPCNRNLQLDPSSFMFKFFIPRYYCHEHGQYHDVEDRGDCLVERGGHMAVTVDMEDG